MARKPNGEQDWPFSVVTSGTLRGTVQALSWVRRAQQLTWGRQNCAFQACIIPPSTLPSPNLGAHHAPLCQRLNCEAEEILSPPRSVGPLPPTRTFGVSFYTFPIHTPKLLSGKQSQLVMISLWAGIIFPISSPKPFHRAGHTWNQQIHLEVPWWNG